MTSSRVRSADVDDGGVVGGVVGACGLLVEVVDVVCEICGV
jgi:hypothetical protein